MPLLDISHHQITSQFDKLLFNKSQILNSETLVDIPPAEITRSNKGKCIKAFQQRLLQMTYCSLLHT